MNLNYDHIRTALYESLGLMLEDILMNEDNEFNIDSVGRHNGGEDTYMDGQAEETSAYSNEWEEVYSVEQKLAGPMRGMFFKSVESSRKPTNQKHTKRIGCEARVNAARKRDGSWMVTKQNDDEISQEREEEEEQGDHTTPQEQEMRGVRYNASRGEGRDLGGRKASQDGGRGRERGTSQDGGRGRGAKQRLNGSTSATNEGEKDEEAEQGDRATPQEQEMSTIFHTQFNLMNVIRFT
ncbi:hypothetical protein RND71_016153 [Anisodus tanguticus]|uniref:Uncharacterized protein n=1 Tax=Anisodus tanguticus TaxID=243964 RepID=A0AAE1VLX6_9SOLA|nr:hypothetical protein RND71_016153 [Anisodus tanguticus]